MLSALARSTLRTSRAPLSRVPVRNFTPEYTVCSGPPTVRISFAEKLIVGGTMCVSLLVVPAWVLVNIKKWNGAEES